MKLNDYQREQQAILYGNGTHPSHDMFLDLDDMVMWCLTCKAKRDNFENRKLRKPCPNRTRAYLARTGGKEEK